jgi:hypothetical protein
MNFGIDDYVFFAPDLSLPVNPATCEACSDIVHTIASASSRLNSTRETRGTGRKSSSLPRLPRWSSALLGARLVVVVGGHDDCALGCSAGWFQQSFKLPTCMRLSLVDSFVVGFPASSFPRAAVEQQLHDGTERGKHASSIKHDGGVMGRAQLHTITVLCSVLSVCRAGWKTEHYHHISV